MSYRWPALPGFLDPQSVEPIVIRASHYLLEVAGRVMASAPTRHEDKAVAETRADPMERNAFPAKGPETVLIWKLEVRGTETHLHQCRSG